VPETLSNELCETVCIIEEGFMFACNNNLMKKVWALNLLLPGLLLKDGISSVSVESRIIIDCLLLSNL
jgi:hypothetical protein